MAPVSTQKPRGLWWVSPAGAVAMITVPMLLIALAFPGAVYRANWGTGRYLTAGMAVLLLQGAATFIAASLLPLLGRRVPVATAWPRFSDRTHHRLLAASAVIFWVTVFGYVMYAAVGLARGARPSDLIAALVSQDTFTGNLRELFAPVAGITTLTQFGIAYAVIGTLLLLDRPTRGVLPRLVLVMLAALMRTFFLTERLAVLELAVPIGVIVCTWLVGSARRWVRVAMPLAPAILIPGVLLFFGAFEYSRSWVFYKSRSNGTFLNFAAERLSGYYVTAFNNGALALQYDRPISGIPNRTAEVFWTAPGVQQLGLLDKLIPGGSNQFLDTLEQRANPEFNSPCGLCDPFVDWGHAGGLIWLGVAGLLLGLAYKGFANGSLLPMLLYPPLATGAFELPRYLYWVQGRLAPALVALLVAGWYAGRPPPQGSQQASEQREAVP